MLQSNSCAMFTISWGGNLCQSFFVAVVYTLWERARLHRIPMWSDFPSRLIAWDGETSASSDGSILSRVDS